MRIHSRGWLLATLMLLQGPTVAVASEVLMVLWRGPTESEESFRRTLEEKAGPVTFTEINGDQNRTNLAGLLRQAEPDIRAGRYSLIYSYGTTVTESVASLVGNTTPIVFNIVVAPIRAGFIQSRERPGRNLTGVSNGVPIAEQFKALQALGPIRRMAVLFNAREPNSNFLVSDVTAWAARAGVSLREFRVAPGTDALDRALAQLSAPDAAEDALYIPADTYLASEAYKIVAALGNKLRIFGGTETFVLRGALATFAPEVADTGVAAALVAARILKGEKPAVIPVITPQPKLIVGRDAAAALGVVIPRDALVREPNEVAAKAGLVN